MAAVPHGHLCSALHRGMIFFCPAIVTPMGRLRYFFAAVPRKGYGDPIGPKTQPKREGPP
ncbi:hypothetical protein CKO11_02010 [Rhodobacter sp. TJ_12]|nr:hypothetical protein [Rhodobacter sp. TJ_12]